MLKNLKVAHAIALVGALPLILVAVLAVSYGSVLLDNIHDARRGNDVVLLSNRLDAVAHNFAVERGLTAGFLGSGGAQGKEAVAKQRLKADAASQGLKSLSPADFEELSPETLESLLAPVLKDLERVSDVRTKVDALASDNGAFVFYSALNDKALHTVQKAITLLRTQTTVQSLSARLGLLWMKERIGQYRGALNGAFSAGAITERRFVQINGFIDNEKVWEAYFKDVASSDQKAQLGAVKQSATWQKVNQALNAFQSTPDLSQLSGPSNWFEMATARIGLVKGVSDQIASDTQAYVETLKSQTLSIFVSVVVGITLVMVAVLALMRIVIRSVSSRVSAVQEAIEAVGLKKDFTVQLDARSSDEIGVIMQVLNEHLTHLSQTFAMLVGKSEESKSSMTSLISQSRTVLEESQDQSSRTDQIAAAVEEMSLTSGTISSDMQDAAKETEVIQKRAAEGRSGMLAIQGAISNLNNEVRGGYDSVQQVTGQTEQIGSILQTIESIAEQTNLLALNAAIEAARAGEQGRGFAVVADEVRSLAQRTQDSTEEIRSMIEALIASGQSALSSMESCSNMAVQSASEVSNNAEMLESLFASIESINMTIERVATAAEEQSQVSEDINQNVQQVRDRSSHIMDSVTTTADEAKETQRRFDQVVAELSSYKLRS